MGVTFPNLSRGMTRVLVGSFVVLLIILTAYQTSIHHQLFNGSSITDQHQNVFAKPTIGTGSLKPIHKFWHDTFVIMNENRPDLGKNEQDAIKYTGSSKDGVKTKQHLLAKAEIAPATVKEIKEKHASFLANLPELKPNVAYEPDTSGIVIVGGGRYSWLAYLSLLALRDAGSTLPVEIIIPKYVDYEKEVEFCTVVLPQYNAACVVIPDVLGPSVMLKWNKKLASYQYKSLALMVSSFQNVLLVDADNIMLENPDSLLESAIYKEYGMVTWPDYWERVTSPVFYEVAGVNVDESKRVRVNRFPLDPPQLISTDAEREAVPFHDFEGAIPDISTESGQLLINKATHAKTLLLSMYYNMYGPTIYYKLLSLGEPGEGDKDTFPAAAVVTNQKYYQVNSNIQTFGYFDNNGDFQGVGMGQKDVNADFNLFNEKVIKAETTSKKTSTEEVQHLKKVLDEEFNKNSIPVFTVHCNFPKLDPINLMNKPELYDEEKKVLKYRMYSGFKYPRKVIENGIQKEVEQDFELLQWTNVKTAICDKSYDFPHLEEKSKDDLCTFINNQVKFLS